MSNEIAKIELSKDLIEPIIRAQLHASIVSAMNRQEELVGQVVNTVMNMKVDSDGKPERYSGGRPLITWMAEDAIKGAAKEAVQEWFSENKETMKIHLRKAIEKSAKGLAEQFVLGIGKAVEARSNIDIQVVMDK